MLENIRIAVCGHLPTACNMLREEGVLQIDFYSDAIDLGLNLRQGVIYHLILICAPYGEGLLNIEYSYKVNLEGEWISVPVRLLNEPACHSALVELLMTVRGIAKALTEENLVCIEES